MDLRVVVVRKRRVKKKAVAQLIEDLSMFPVRLSGTSILVNLLDAGGKRATFSSLTDNY